MSDETDTAKHSLESFDSEVALKKVKLESEDVESPDNASPLVTSSDNQINDPSTEIVTEEKVELMKQKSAKNTSTDDIIKQSGRKVEDIIDGSDLRKFLNKTLTYNITQSLNEIVQQWENGEFSDVLETQDLNKKVTEKFIENLKKFT